MNWVRSTLAAVNGDIDLIKTLIRDGLDIDDFMNCEYNCLMMACHGNKDQLVSYLIQSGADLDKKNDNGETAVHICAKQGSLGCLMLLVDNGAQVNVSDDEHMTPLRLASERGRAPVVQYLTGLPSCSPAAKIEALELMGTVWVKNGNFQRACKYWSMALEERAKAGPSDLLQPKSQLTHPVYGNTREFNTVEELNRISSSAEDMKMQALIIRERILGFGDTGVYYNFVDKARAYLEAGDYNRCISIGMYILDVQFKSYGFQHETMRYPLSSLIKVLSLMTSKDIPATYDQIRPVLIKGICMTELATKAYAANTPRSSHDNFQEIILLVLSSIGFIAKCPTQISDQDRLDFHQLLYEFVHLSPRDIKDRTPLHWACKFSDHSAFPPDVVKLLLEAGADPRAVQCEGRTPLHMACKNDNSSFSTLEVVELLLEAGASPAAMDRDGNIPLHLVSKNNHPSKQDVIKLMLFNSCWCTIGVCNAGGKWFTDYLPNEMLGDIENLCEFYKLQCLSVKAVLRYKIPYESILPTKLAKFIKMH